MATDPERPGTRRWQGAEFERKEILGFVWRDPATGTEKLLDVADVWWIVPEPPRDVCTCELIDVAPGHRERRFERARPDGCYVHETAEQRTARLAAMREARTRD